jgi:hypothetical protein
MTATVTIARGSIHLPAEIYERHFAGLEGIILQRRNDDLLIMPVRHALAGGYLIKRRNARGDRIVSSMDFFRSQGMDDDVEIKRTTQWDETLAGLRARNVFAGNTCHERATG